MKSRKSKSSSPPRHGFTLVRLIVVIAIVALLVALVVPTIERLRAQASLAQCRDSLRKIGDGLILYARANGGRFPVCPTIENPHGELLGCLGASQLAGNPKNYYCPSEHRRELSFSESNFKSGIIGYYYFSAVNSGADPALSKFLRKDDLWPRELNAGMDPKTWVMSDIWVSSLPTAHSGFKKGVNYLKLDGSVDFVAESPRRQFH